MAEYSTRDRSKLFKTGVVSSADIESGAIAGSLGYTPVDKSGDTMTGPLVVDTGYQEGLRILRNYDVSQGVAGQAIQLGAKLNGTPVYPVEIIGVTDTDGTAYGTEIRQDGNLHLSIDSSGRVTMPYQPAFRATGPAAEDAAPITFTGQDSAFSGRNVNFNPANGTFTAPITGVYMFSFSFLHGNGGSTDYVRVLFKINGYYPTTYGDTLESYGFGYGNTSMGMAFKLQANDTVSLQNVGQRIYGTSYGSFSGFFIG